MLVTSSRPRLATAPIDVGPELVGADPVVDVPAQPEKPRRSASMVAGRNPLRAPLNVITKNDFYARVISTIDPFDSAVVNTKEDAFVEMGSNFEIQNF